MCYLAEHTSFVALIMREELDGGTRLNAASRSSTAMRDAFQAVRRAGRGRGLRRFRVDEAVVLFVALTFAPFSYRDTLLRATGVDVTSPGGRRKQSRLATDQLMHMLCAEPPSERS
jgi:hypothetical protein